MTPLAVLAGIVICLVCALKVSRPALQHLDTPSISVPNGLAPRELSKARADLSQVAGKYRVVSSQNFRCGSVGQQILVGFSGEGVEEHLTVTDHILFFDINGLEPQVQLPSPYDVHQCGFSSRAVSGSDSVVLETYKTCKNVLVSKTVETLSRNGSRLSYSLNREAINNTDLDVNWNLSCAWESLNSH